MSTITPGSPEWRQLITASKVPTILGVSPFTDAYTLYHEVKGNVPGFEGNKATERGKYLEQPTLDWFADQHPDLIVSANKKQETLYHRDNLTWAATPDAFVLNTNGELRLAEAKTSLYADGWGKPGTADIPIYYLAQVIWQMICTRVRIVHVPVLFGSSFEFQEYVVTWDDVADMVDTIEGKVLEFQDRLATNDPPEPTGPAAYDTTRVLHPDIDLAAVVELDRDLAARYVHAVTAAKAAEAEEKDAKAAVNVAMGTAKKATWNGQPVATRISKSGGLPYVSAARTLPEI